MHRIHAHSTHPHSPRRRAPAVHGRLRIRVKAILIASLAIGLSLVSCPADATSPRPFVHAPVRTVEGRAPGINVVRRIDMELHIGGNDGLPATLSLPHGKGPFAAVVLVHGSGAHDRDETIGANRPFRDIAHGLAERGIAVLRYEKRTHRHPWLRSDPDLTIDRETTHDALLAIARLRQLRAIDARRIFVLGHSQGGMLAPRIAGRAPDVAGIILLAAPARPLLDLLVEQHRRAALLDDGVINDAEELAMRRLVDATRAIRSGRESPHSSMPMGLPTQYWRSVDAVDPLREARGILQPMLILQGGRDLHVTSTDWLLWRTTFRDTTRVSFAHYGTLNHLGIPEHGPVSIHAYQVPGQVAPELLDDIALWIGLLRDVRRG